MTEHPKEEDTKSILQDVPVRRDIKEKRWGGNEKNDSTTGTNERKNTNDTNMSQREENQEKYTNI